LYAYCDARIRIRQQSLQPLDIGGQKGLGAGEAAVVLIAIRLDREPSVALLKAVASHCS
jgi:hypothetical protein